LFGAIGFAFGVAELDFGALSLGLEAIEFRLMPARIDHEKDIAFFNKLAGLETHFLDVTGYARAYFDGFHRLGATGKFIPFDNFTLLDRRDRNGRRGRLLLLGGAALAAAGEESFNGSKQQYGSGNTNKIFVVHDRFGFEIWMLI
jgi:hypothetical protein